ncbi:MAG: hypothetical protein ACOCRN_05075 [Spirochaetia bacterium]
MYTGQRLVPRSIGIVVLFVVLVVSAGAFSFSPMVSDIELDGSRPRRRYTVANDAASPVAVQVRAFERSIGVDGEESRSPASDLQVFPSQLVLGGGERQEVVVEWTGGELERERAFRVVAEQVAVDLDDDPQPQARIRMNMRYVASLYVTPEGAGAQPRVLEALVVEPDDEDLENGEDGAPAYAEVLLENSGSSHVLLRDLAFEVAVPDNGEDDTIVIDGEDRVDGASGVLPAGNERRILLRLPQEFAGAAAGSSLEATIAE